MTDDDPARIEAAIDELLGDAVTDKEHHPEYTRWRLVVRPPSEFGFEVFLYTDGEPQFGAFTSPVERHVWAAFFERPDYRTTAERNAQFFLKLRNALTHPTRIRWRRGLLWWSTACEYLVDGEWRPLGGYAAFRSAWRDGVEELPRRGVWNAEPVLTPPGFTEKVPARC